MHSTSLVVTSKYSGVLLRILAMKILVLRLSHIIYSCEQHLQERNH